MFFWHQREDKGSGTLFAAMCKGSEEPGGLTTCTDRASVERSPSEWPPWTKTLGQSNRKKCSVLTLPCRKLFRKLSSLPSVKTGILPTGSESCQTTSYHNPSRRSPRSEGTAWQEEAGYGAGSTGLRGSGRSQAAPEDEKRHREGMTGLLDVVWFLPCCNRSS